MKITIRSFAMIREILGEKRIEKNVNSKKLEDILQEIIVDFPELKNHLLSDEGWSARFLYLVNQNKIEFAYITTTQLSDGDELTILPPAGGGLKN